MRFVTRVGVYGIVRSVRGVLAVRLPAGPWAGSWDLPGGALEPGESPAEAVARHLAASFGGLSPAVDPSALLLRDASADVAEWETPDGVVERLHRVAIVYEVAVIVSPDVEPTADVVHAWSPLNPRTPLADRFR